MDIIRGISILLMIWHHLMFDVRYIFKLDAFVFFESYIFQEIIHPLLLIGFFMMSGISGTFSHDNLNRLKKMSLIALSISLVSSLLSWIFQADFYMFWQIIHSLTFCIGIMIILERLIIKEKTKHIIYLFLALLMIFVLPYLIKRFDLARQGSPWLLPFGIGYLNPRVPGMADYIPVIPLGGFFFIGISLGKILYPGGLVKKERFTSIVWAPLRFFGRRSLLVYAVHQPILIILIWLYGRFFL